MIEKWFEAFTRLNPTPASDGLGAAPPALTEDLPFLGALTYTPTREFTAGERPVLSDAPVLLYEYDVTLAPGDRVRREKDGAVYRVTGQGMQAPAWSGLRFAQAQVERLVIPC